MGRQFGQIDLIQSHKSAWISCEFYLLGIMPEKSKNENLNLKNETSSSTTEVIILLLVSICHEFKGSVSLDISLSIICGSLPETLISSAHP